MKSVSDIVGKFQVLVKLLRDVRDKGNDKFVIISFYKQVRGQLA